DPLPADVRDGRPPLVPPVAVGYLAAFALLSGALAAGMPLGVAYGIWSAFGIVATAVLSRILFREPLTKLMLGGMGLIVVGVLLVELGGVHGRGAAPRRHQARPRPLRRRRRPRHSDQAPGPLRVTGGRAA